VKYTPTPTSVIVIQGPHKIPASLTTKSLNVICFPPYLLKWFIERRKNLHAIVIKIRKQSFSGKDYHLLVSSTACERVVFPEIMLWPVTVDRGVVLRAPLLDKADRKAVVSISKSRRL